MTNNIMCISGPREALDPEGGGGTPLQEANEDVPRDGVAFSRLE